MTHPCVGGVYDVVAFDDASICRDVVSSSILVD